MSRTETETENGTETETELTPPLSDPFRVRVEVLEPAPAPETSSPVSEPIPVPVQRQMAESQEQMATALQVAREGFELVSKRVTEQYRLQEDAHERISQTVSEMEQTAKLMQTVIGALDEVVRQLGMVTSALSKGWKLQQEVLAELRGENE